MELFKSEHFLITSKASVPVAKILGSEVRAPKHGALRASLREFSAQRSRVSLTIEQQYRMNKRIHWKRHVEAA